MPVVVGVQFKPVTKIYYFDPDNRLDLLPGDYVVVDTAKGREVAQIVQPPHTVPPEEIVGEIKKVVRRATPWDLLQRDLWRHKEMEALAICRRKAKEHGLKMKVTRCEYNFDGGRLTVFFTAEKRVDFRALVRDLARTFQTRIEMRQIGVRDEAKLLDGVGKCGRQLCCTSWLREFAPVSVRMAKNQQLPLNPDEISGVCGRLLCCLSYEDELYKEQNRKMPKVGAEVVTPQGKGRVRHLHPLKETVTVKLENNVLAEFSIHELITGKRDSGGCGPCGGCTAKRRATAEEDNARLRAARAKAAGEMEEPNALDEVGEGVDDETADAPEHPGDATAKEEEPSKNDAKRRSIRARRRAERKRRYSRRRKGPKK